jgi:hypothetical protein
MADNRFKIKNGLLVEAGGSEITGSLIARNITGSLFGTASWAQNVLTASYVTGSSFGPSNPVLSASYAVTASYVIGGASTIAVQDEGVAQGSAGTFNFTGAGVSAAVGGGIATINIPGAGGTTFPYTGSAIISGSLIVTGSVSSTGGFTGSLLGTSSWAHNSTTASYVTASNVYGPYGNNSILSASYALSASYVIGGASTITIQDEGATQGSAGTLNFVGGGVTATVAGGLATINIIAQSGSVSKLTQSSPAATWSFAHNLGERYPLVNIYDSAGDAIIPGRIETVDSNNLNVYFTVAQSGTAVAMLGGTATTASYANTLTVTSTLLSTQQNTDVDVGTETIATVATGSYRAAFFDYYANDGTNYRAGTVMSTWNTVGSVTYTDNSTPDIGNTSGVTLAVVANGSNVELRATVTSNNWNIKAFARAL